MAVTKESMAEVIAEDFGVDLEEVKKKVEEKVMVHLMVNVVR